MPFFRPQTLVLASTLALTLALSACSSPGAAGSTVTSVATTTASLPTATPSPAGMAVADPVNHVHWLADANLAATQRFGLPLCDASNTTPCVNASGSMTYQAAAVWVAAMNAAHYLGHTDWQLPTTPLDDTLCSKKGPNGNFGYNCINSTMGALYSKVLGLKEPDTAVPIPDTTVGPFSNFQPYLYWSDTVNGHGPNLNGFYAFSFATGHLGGNVNDFSMYVLPMVKGKVPGTYSPTGRNGLQISADGKLVYDPGASVGGGTGVTWLANADLAKSQTFGAQCVNSDGTQCINPDGSMSHTTAENWIAGMNKANGGAGWLGQTDWVLPPNDPTDTTCDQQNYGFGCTGSPMGELFYAQLGLKAGASVIQTPNINFGSFHDMQPYLYWSCEGAPDDQGPCSSDVPAKGFEYSFSFGNGFEGTDPGGVNISTGNELCVTAYYPG